MFSRCRPLCPDLWMAALLGLMVLFTTACAGPPTQSLSAGLVTPTTPRPQPVATAGPTARAAAASPAGAGDTLRLFYWQAPTTLNAHLTAGQKDREAARITYEPLASFDNNGQMTLFLAAEIPSLQNGGVAADGRSVTWKLKQGVKWSDGQPFTAHDVLFTYEYIMNPKVASSDTPTYSIIKNVEVLDDYTVKVNFKEVTPAWFLPFVGELGHILPRHVFADYNGANFNEAPANLKAVGTGPYRVIEYTKEDVLIIGSDVVNTIKILYEANPYFREADKPFFKRVELRGGGGDAVVAAKAIQNSLADYAWNLTVGNDVIGQIETSGKGKVVAQPSKSLERIMLNFADHRQQTADGERAHIQFPHPFFSDKRVRQALAHAVDREAIGKLYGRSGNSSTNILVMPTSYQSTKSNFYPFDLKKAAEWLDQAGWAQKGSDGIRVKDGVRLSLLFQTTVNPVRQGAQDIVRKALASIGVEVELKSIDSSIFFGPITPGNPNPGHSSVFYADLEEFAFSTKSPDPGPYMRIWLCSEASQKSNNWAGTNNGRYCNPAYDTLFKQTTTELDPDKRRQLYIQMNDLLVEDVALIPLVHTADPVGIGADLEGPNITNWDSSTWNIKDWRRK